MRTRSLLFCTAALALAAVFTRFGVWQLSRLREKRARNATILVQQRGQPVPFVSLPRDTAGAHYRPASVEGRFDYEHELVLAGRTHQGSPGVELVIPVRVAESDTAVLVNRGWVYSPDAGTVDRARWREGDSAALSGYVELYAPDAESTAPATDARLIRRVSAGEIAGKVPYPVAPYYLVVTSGEGDRTPARRDAPMLGDGPHFSYAMQWFTFAAFALVGAGVVVARERRGRDLAPTPPAELSSRPSAPPAS